MPYAFVAHLSNSFTSKKTQDVAESSPSGGASSLSSHDPRKFQSHREYRKSNPGWDNLSGAGTDERGVALILVTFIIALASILVINLAYSTTLGSRQSANIQRSTQDEYLLKSAVNFARVLIKEDKTSEDSPKDTWGTFINGVAVPPQLLGISDNNIHLELEIRPEDSKMPIGALLPPGFSTPDAKWRQAFTALFQNPPLDFDNDKEVDQTGIFQGRHFKCNELVGNLIDYMDPDTNPTTDGIEGDPNLPDDIFPNASIKRIGELAAIPGFSPTRVRRIIPYVSAVGAIGGNINRVNINLAPSLVIKALSESIDDAMVTQILEFRASQDGPFTEQNYISKLTEILGDSNLVSYISPMIAVRSRWYQVIAKVDYGTAIYFMRAYLVKQTQGELPDIQSVELF